MPEPEQDRPEFGESDIADLASKFATKRGGNLSPEYSANLALEIVLNEIVQQACLATGAHGAAVLLERDGEMECRATTGSNAPELGARLSSDSGLTAECMKTKLVQVCADAQLDPRVNAEASRHLGVRSVMVLPLLRGGGELVGVLEVFSARPGAFGARDELTLQALARRILKNLQRASEPIATAEEKPLPAPVVPISRAESSGKEISESVVEDSAAAAATNAEDFVSEEAGEQPSRTGLDILTFALGVAVVCVAVLLVTLVGWRLGWRRSAGGRRARVSHMASGSNGAARNTAEQTGTAQRSAGPGTADAKAETDAGAASVAPGSAVPGAGNSPAGDRKNTATSQRIPSSHGNESFPPAGGLTVYEDGREVFRMAPTPEPGEATSGAVENADGKGLSDAGVQPASKLENVDRRRVSAEAAEGSLLHRVEPEYPEEARRRRIQGPVVLDVRAGRDGSIQEVKLVRGQRLLAEAAMAAVKQWRFKPLVVKGQAVEMETTITLNFRLPQ